LYPSGNAKYDNVRVWSVLRFDSEIANNYNTCLTNNETGLGINYMFDGFNQKNIANKTINYLVKYGVIEGNGYSFSNGSGCGVTPPFSLVVVTGSFAGTYYYARMFNGKPRYRIVNLECGIFLNESPCDNASGITQILWDSTNNRWILVDDACVWLFTTCTVTYDLNDPNTYTLYATNPATTTLAPCTGWTFSNAANSATFSSDECALLNNTTFEISNFEVYPNPFANSFTINCKEEVSITIYNVMGEMLKKQVLSLGVNTIVLENESKGIYFAKIENDKGSETIKLVKE